MVGADAGVENPRRRLLLRCSSSLCKSHFRRTCPDLYVAEGQTCAAADTSTRHEHAAVDDRAAQQGAYPREIVSLSLPLLRICSSSFQARRSLKSSGTFFRKGHYWLPLIPAHAVRRLAIPPFYVLLSRHLLQKARGESEVRRARHERLNTLSCVHGCLRSVDSLPSCTAAAFDTTVLLFRVKPGGVGALHKTMCGCAALLRGVNECLNRAPQ